MTLGLITVALSATISAPLDRVWDALTDPSERPAWDERILGPVAVRPGLDARHRRRGRGGRADRGAGSRNKPTNDPALESRRWRYRLGGVPLILQEDLVSREPKGKLVTRVAIGSAHLEQTLTLHPEDDETGPRTRLGMKIAARNSIAVLGDSIERLDVQRLVIEYVDTTLRQVQKYCESGPEPDSV